jgi:hypothetical protein
MLKAAIDKRIDQVPEWIKALARKFSGLWRGTYANNPPGDFTDGRSATGAP